MAGLYDGYRRAKIATQVVRDGFARKAAGELPAETLAEKMVDQINELKKEGAKCQ